MIIESAASRIVCHTTEVVGVGIVHAEMKKNHRGAIWELCSSLCKYLRAEKRERIR